MAVLGIIAAVAGAISYALWKTYYKPQEPVEDPPLEEPEPPPMNEQTETGKQLYAKSKSFLGTEPTPKDEIPDVVACVSNLQVIFFKTTGRYIGQGAALYSTKALKEWMLQDKNFTRVDDPLPGDILVYATGEGNGMVSNGHCFVVGNKDYMSNNSFTGLWSADYTRETAAAYYEKKGGFTPYFFRPK